MLYKLPTQWLGKPLRVAVLGCGGTGYYIGTNLFMLQRIIHSTFPEAAFERIDLYDAKDIKEPNLARTGYLHYEIGLNKADVLANRLNAALGHETFRAYNENASTHHLRGYDLIITATDSYSSRNMVADMDTNALWLDTGVDKATASFVLGELSMKADKLPNSHDLFTNTDTIEQHQTTSCDMQTSLEKQAFGINQQVAGQAINLISQMLFDGEINYHGGLIDLKEGVTTPIRVDKEVWASMGYECP